MGIRLSVRAVLCNGIDDFRLARSRSKRRDSMTALPTTSMSSRWGVAIPAPAYEAGKRFFCR
ncbi:hypothetical protein IE4872_CH00293 [Rhizobium gallicum]|uniref:Uncharacterized protein n=1 Tax=Rhizobium gallicum TaxID=56730 RepID=A0A1L5NDJ5_9HYPH|nr:hypothetical protein IE4872_CH00293 [Rhizobium gallicum]